MVSTQDYYAHERAGDGWVQVWRDLQADAPWFVTFLPDPKPAERLTGHTYTPTDPDLPDDYPRSNDPAQLLEWARRRAAQ